VKKKPTVEEAIQSLPKAELAIVRRLRALITECLPKAEEKGYYGLGVPFYTRHRMICFIWPSSFMWGKKPKDNTGKLVTLGFCQGNLMSNEDGALKAEGRKQVYCLYINSLADIREEQIRSLLFEAELIDETFSRRKKHTKVRS
jgi:Domain of unknown function (DU1801)